MARRARRAAVPAASVRGGQVPDQVWNRFDSCLEDARSAIERIDAERTLLLGFSMGGAVAISVADDPRVEGVLGLAPWIPDRLSVEPLRGRRLDVIHGSLDRAFPGIPASHPPIRAPASSARERSASRAPTRSSMARCTRSRSARGVRCRFRARGRGRVTSRRISTRSSQGTERAAGVPHAPADQHQHER